jgi:hypothetical protein
VQQSESQQLTRSGIRSLSKWASKSMWWKSAIKKVSKKAYNYRQQRTLEEQWAIGSYALNLVRLLDWHARRCGVDGAILFFEHLCRRHFVLQGARIFWLCECWRRGLTLIISRHFLLFMSEVRPRYYDVIRYVRFRNRDLLECFKEEHCC